MQTEMLFFLFVCFLILCFCFRLMRANKQINEMNKFSVFSVKNKHQQWKINKMLLID